MDIDRDLEEFISGALLGIILLGIAALSLCDTKPTPPQPTTAEQKQ